MEKIIAALSITLIMSLPVMAIEPPEGVTLPYEGTSQGYTGTQFNEALEVYGLMLSSEAAKRVPSCFARIVGDTIKFDYYSMMCSPSEYHSILAAYGLELTPDDVSSKLGIYSYATVKDDEVILNDRYIMFYSPSEWKIILGAYSMAR